MLFITNVTYSIGEDVVHIMVELKRITRHAVFICTNRFNNTAHLPMGYSQIEYLLIGQD